MHSFLFRRFVFVLSLGFCVSTSSQAALVTFTERSSSILEVTSDDPALTVKSVNPVSADKWTVYFSVDVPQASNISVFAPSTRLSAWADPGCGVPVPGSGTSSSCVNEVVGAFLADIGVFALTVFSDIPPDQGASGVAQDGEVLAEALKLYTGNGTLVMGLDFRFLDLGDAVSVPEPASLALTALGLAGLGVGRRRRAKATR